MYFHDDHAFNDSPVLHVKTDRTDQYGYAGIFEGRVGIGTTAPGANLHISDDTTSLVTGLLVENVGSDGNSATVSGIEIKNGAGTDSSTHIEQDAFGITRMYTGQGAKNEFLHVSADAGTFTIAGDLKVSGNDIKSSAGDTVITLSNNDATFADNVTIGNKLFVSDSFLRDDGANLKIVGESQTQYQVQGQYGAHIFYTQDGSSSAPNNYTNAFKINYLGNLELGNNRDRTIAMNDTAHDTAGKDLTISAGDTTAGTTDNIAGGDLIFEGGIGKGTGAGGDIIFRLQMQVVAEVR